MAVINGDIRLFGLVKDNPQSLDALLLRCQLRYRAYDSRCTNLVDFPPWDGRSQVAVAEQAKIKKRERNFFREEDLAYSCRYICECIANASDYEILKE